MNNLKQTILLILTVSILTSCDFINNAFTYEDTTEGFVDAVIKENYEKSLTFMATDNDAYKNTNIDSLKLGLMNFQNLIVNNFGEELDYKFMTANKTFSTVEGKVLPQIQLKLKFNSQTMLNLEFLKLLLTMFQIKYCILKHWTLRRKYPI